MSVYKDCEVSWAARDVERDAFVPARSRLRTRARVCARGRVPSIYKYLPLRPSI